MVTVRKVEREEWPQVQAFFKHAINEPLPHPDGCAVVLAEEDGLPIGFLVVQALIHAEPLWVHPGYRRRYIVGRLIREVCKLFPELNYCFVNAKTPRMASFLEKIGFQRMPWIAMRWLRRL